MSRIADHVGRVLGGRYRLLAPIGTGASAHVYLADDVSLGRRVAVKILHPALATDESFLHRFRVEAQAAAVLNHPNLMKVMDWGEDEDGPYLVLEYLAGGSLRDILDAGHRLSVTQACAVGSQAAHALAYAHRRGLVHRDVKPANLVFDDEGRLCLADFGLARALADAAWTEPLGALLGTARYASPEQARAQPVEGRADVYSLALVLIEAVTGEVPFVADTTISTLMARARTPLRVPERMGELQGVIEQASALDPLDRLDAASLALNLDELAKGLARPEPLPLSPPVSAYRPSGQRDGDVKVVPLRSSGDAPDPEGVPTLRALVLRDDRLGSRVRHPSAAGSAVLFDQEAVAATPPPPRPRWMLGWRWLVLVCALVAGAAAAVVFGTGMLVPSHPLPSVRGETLQQARARVSALHMGLAVVGRRFDSSVPAGDIASQSPPARSSAKEGTTVDVVVSRGPAPVAVPALAGDDEDAAVAALAKVGLAAKINPTYSETVPSRQVIDWSPRSGKVLPGTTVTVVVSAGPAPRTVPNLANAAYAAAVAQLQQLGLTAARQDAFNNTVPAGSVVSTSPGAGAQVARGSSVTVVVSKGPDLVVVPDVAHQSVDSATAAMAAAGLQVANVFGPPNQAVVSTAPSPGAQVPRGSSVNLVTHG